MNRALKWFFIVPGLLIATFYLFKIYPTYLGSLCTIIFVMAIVLVVVLIRVKRMRGYKDSTSLNNPLWKSALRIVPKVYIGYAITLLIFIVIGAMVSSHALPILAIVAYPLILLCPGRLFGFKNSCLISQMILFIAFYLLSLIISLIISKKEKAQKN